MSQEFEREQLEVDVLLVGAGPASLSAAFHLSRLVDAHNDRIASGDLVGQPLEPTVLVVEKGKEIGAHALSGAVIDPEAFRELLEGTEHSPPYDRRVTQDSVHVLTENSSYRLPVTPPPLRNHDCYVASLGDIVKWLSGLCEENGVEVYPGFPASQLLIEGNRVIGARMADSGIDREGKPKPNFEPGMDVLAKVSVLGEGPCGTLTGQAQRKGLLKPGPQPQIYALGVKEVWKSPAEVTPGQVFHTLGYPLGSSEFGGGFIYTMSENLVSLGFVVGLDYKESSTDGHRLLQEFKQHPFVRGFVEGGELLSYGAKAIPEGGYYAKPEPYAPGLLVVGDSAGFLNSQRLKGTHLAVKSGMLAAETIFEALTTGDSSSEALSSYKDRLEGSWLQEELWRVRNFRQSFQKGFWRGVLHTGIQFLTGGRGLSDPMPIQAGHTFMRPVALSGSPVGDLEADANLTFNKLDSVYYSDTAHEENQPSHLKVLDPSICDSECTEKFGNPCQYFCPANVYEILADAIENRLRINFSNCVHCKTCEIMDPYQIILWTPPEGGGGPNWNKM